MAYTPARLVLTACLTFSIAEAFQPWARQSVAIKQDGEVRVEPKDPADLQSLSQLAQLGVTHSNHPPEKIGQLNEHIPPPLPTLDDSDGLFLYEIRLPSILKVAGLLSIMVLLFMAAPAVYHHLARILLQTPRDELLANGCVLLYTVATITVDIIIQTLLMRSGGKFGFHPSVMVFLAEFGKLGLNSILAMAD